MKISLKNYFIVSLLFLSNGTLEILKVDPSVFNSLNKSLLAESKLSTIGGKANQSVFVIAMSFAIR